MKVGIIGVGNIGKIILNRLLRAGKIKKSDIVKKIEHLAKRGTTIAKNNKEEVVEKSDVIFFASNPRTGYDRKRNNSYHIFLGIFGE